MKANINAVCVPQNGTKTMSDFPVDAAYMLDVWMALGVPPSEFEAWYNHPKRTPADAWAQLLQAIRDPSKLNEDSNPPAGTLAEWLEPR